MGSERPTLQEVQYDFRGGINSNLPLYMVQANQLATAEDCILHRGGIRKNSGYSSILTTVPATSRGLGLFYTRDLLNAVLVYKTSNGKLYRVCAQRATPIGSGFAAANKMTFAIANRKLYVFDNSVNMRGWSGTTATPIFTPAAVPPEICRFGYYSQQHNRMFAGYGATNFQRVWFSDINAYETWPANNFFDIPESRTGDIVRGFAPLYDRLVIFGEKTVSVLYGRTPSDFQLRTVEWRHGCPYPFTIVSFGSHVLYLSSDGIYSFDGSGAATKVSLNIDTALTEQLESQTRTNNTYFVGGQLGDGPVAYADRYGNYVVSVNWLDFSTGAPAPTLNNNREIIVGPPKPEAPYWRVLGYNKRGFSSYYSLTFGPTQTFAQLGSGNGNIFEIDKSFFYNGVGIDMIWESKQFDCGDPFRRKEFLTVEVHAEIEENTSAGNKQSQDYSLRLQYKTNNQTQWQEAGIVPISRVGPLYGDKAIGVSQTRGAAMHPLLLPEGKVVGSYIQLRARMQGDNAIRMPVHFRGWRVTARPLKENE